MMKVLFIVPSLRRAGAETQVVDLVNALRDPEILCQLVCFQPDLSQRDRVPEAVRFHHVPRRGKYDLSFIRGIAHIIDREDIDVVHCTLEFSVLVGWLSIRRARRKPCLIGAIHTTLIRNLKEQLHDRLIYQWIFRQCNSIIFVCQKQADFWIARYPFLAKNSTVIHNGIDLARFSGTFRDEKASDLPGRLALPADAYIISCIAGFRPEKRHDLLLAAFGRLDANAHLYLAGDGALRCSVESLADQMGLQDRVHFLGNIEDVRPLLLVTDITVLASKSETFSIAMLESMAMGVPMVAPDIGGLSEAIVHDQTGWIYPAGDVDRLAGLLAQGARDRAKLKAMGALARQTVEKYYSRDVMADSTASLLRSVAGWPRRKPL
jgi:glycosyltransferase involved in cell wall biosynthesis